MDIKTLIFIKQTLEEKYKTAADATNLARDIYVKKLSAAGEDAAAYQHDLYKTAVANEDAARAALHDFIGQEWHC